MPNKSDVTFAVVGAGGRGRMFAEWCLNNLGKGSVVAVADPDPDRRLLIGQMHDLPQERCYDGWKSFALAPKMADAAINATMDRDHDESAVALMCAGYHLLQEKPMGVTLEEAREIDRVRRETQRIVLVCHSMRYHAAGVKLKELLDSGVIGKLISVDHIEMVELIHQSHSFVRGNWGVLKTSAPMLLAKSCHDIDFITFLLGKPCERVSSFGSLTYFRPENAPQGAPQYCVEGCPAETDCAFYAPKIYGGDHWVAEAARLKGLSRDELTDKLRTDRYGRCVFRCGNDVVDHQVVALEYAGGTTVTFSVNGFTPFGGRYSRFHGTTGYIALDFDKQIIDVWKTPGDQRHEHIQLEAGGGGHGGDEYAMATLVEAIRSNAPDRVLTGTAESLATHTITFAAEKARLDRRVVELSELEGA